MIRHSDIGQGQIRQLIRSGVLCLGGHIPGKIYGTLSCPSGKRMKRENRVFFQSEEEALGAGYRPCARCMPEKYKAWKIALS